MSKKKKVIWSLAVVAIVAGGYFWYSRSKNPDEGIEVEKVGKGDVMQTVSVTGELVPVEYADLSFQNVGRVNAVFVVEGNTVKKGDPIASIDSSVLDAQIREAYLALSVAEEAEKLARRGWKSLKPEEREAKKLATEQAREDIRTLYVQKKLTTIFSPMDGIVSKFDSRVGETVTAGGVVARVSSGGGSVLEAQVPESDVAKMRIGMKALVTFDALTRNDVFSVDVLSIDPASTVIQDVVSYKTEFSIGNVDPRLREGMTANIDIETASVHGVLTVPFRAVVKEGQKSFVEVRRGPGAYERVEVSLGLEGDEGMIEAQSGLSEGDEVVVSRK